MPRESDHLSQPLSTVARKDVATLPQDSTIQEALDIVRSRGVGEKIIYFYTVDADGRLSGVVPTRRLLTAPLEQHLSEVMITRVLSLPETATVMDACEAFVMHKFLAIPVVDAQRRLVGVVDVGLLTQEAFDIAEREQTNQLFESIGFHLSGIREASAFRAFRFRIPWLMATIASGTVCALLASRFEITLATSVVLAFFMTLVLGLAESVSIQSMTVTIQALRGVRPTVPWYLKALRREVSTAILIGGTCGSIVALIVWLWRGTSLPALAIGGSIAVAIGSACFFGLTVPAVLHALKLDPKIAAGPVTLALTDIATLLAYLGIATLLL